MTLAEEEIRSLAVAMADDSGKVKATAAILRVVFELIRPLERQQALEAIGYHPPCGDLDTVHCQCDNDE